MSLVEVVQTRAAPWQGAAPKWSLTGGNPNSNPQNSILNSGGGPKASKDTKYIRLNIGKAYKSLHWNISIYCLKPTKGKRLGQTGCHWVNWKKTFYIQVLVFYLSFNLRFCWYGVLSFFRLYQIMFYPAPDNLSICKTKLYFLHRPGLEGPCDCRLYIFARHLTFKHMKTSF